MQQLTFEIWLEEGIQQGKNMETHLELLNADD